MIVLLQGSEYRLITQPDHAHLSAEILSLWREDGLPANPRRAEILFAAREHDNGWRETDSAPHWDPDRGRPHDFLSLPDEERFAVWRRGIARFAASRPYAALLVAHHALALGERRQDRKDGGGRSGGGWRELLDEIEELRAGLVEAAGAAGVPEAAVEADYRFLALADLLSLAVCNAWTEPFEARGVSGVPRHGALGLDPFPLAGATRFRVPCRRIPARAYRGDADLGGELAAARWEELEVRLEPV
jgi:hypothetical protein